MRRSLFIAALAVAAGCFEPWSVNGPYRCGAGACPDSMICDDGVCCFPDKAPQCRALVLDGGTCASGATPQMYYEDLDGDGFGNPKAGKLYCAKPVSDPYVEDNTDCDDTSAEANPRGQEICDGRDNDCNGQIDEGLVPQKTFFRDQDGDGYGDPSKPFTACAAPPGYVENNSDCGPDQIFRHPGAPELCNGRDDNCDGVTDESPTDIGQSCLDGGFGECAAGTTACFGGRIVCASTNTPQPDICDGLDNNCNGQVDEQPECGGPINLLGPGVLTGALNMNQAVPFATSTSTCLKNFAGATGESWSAPSWSGSSANHHIWYAEAPAGRTWDLSRTGLKLYLHFNWAFVGGASVAWDSSQQPVVYLCGTSDTSFNRYVPSPDSLLDAGTAQGSQVSAELPIAAGAGSGWVVGFGSTLDLKKVKRVEVLVKPRYTIGGNNPTFTITWRADAGFH